MTSGFTTEQEQNQKSTVDQTQLSYFVPQQMSYSTAMKTQINSTEIPKPVSTQQKNDQLKISLNFRNDINKIDK